MEQQRQKYAGLLINGRRNLLSAIIFTTINLLLIIANASIYFPFSIFLPQFMIVLGLYFQTGYGITALIIFIIFAIILTALFLLVYLLSKKNPDWLIAALILFSVDTVNMLILTQIFLTIDFYFIIDIAFHAWVLYYLISAVSSLAKLKKLPPVQAETAYPQTSIPADGSEARLPQDAMHQPGSENSTPDSTDNDNTDAAPRTPSDGGSDNDDTYNNGNN